MKRVIIESPYKANGDNTVRDHIYYARRCVLDSVLRGESPIASHLLLPQVLDDNIPSERQMGIAAGLAWRPVADLSTFYTDYGWSTGMLDALGSCIAEGLPYNIRALDGPAQIPDILRSTVSAGYPDCIIKG